MSESAAARNPYVGPRSLRYGESIYGRDREARQLLELLIAERVVFNGNLKSRSPFHRVHGISRATTRRNVTTPLPPAAPDTQSSSEAGIGRRLSNLS